MLKVLHVPENGDHPVHVNVRMHAQKDPKLALPAYLEAQHKQEARINS